VQHALHPIYVRRCSQFNYETSGIYAYNPIAKSAAPQFCDHPLAFLIQSEPSTR